MWLLTAAARELSSVDSSWSVQQLQYVVIEDAVLPIGVTAVASAVCAFRSLNAACAEQGLVLLIAGGLVAAPQDRRSVLGV
jgi:hypothetical protein